MRALIVTNMYPSPARPAFGSFVRDQVEALRRIQGTDVAVFSFAARGPGSYARAAAELRGRGRADGFDVVHAHFGLTSWPALAARGPRTAVTLHGTDLAHPRSRAITLAALPLLDLVATVSGQLAAALPGWAVRGRQAVLPCGVDTRRFRPIPRADARAGLGLERDGRYLLFPSSAHRAEKRYDRAAAVAGAGAGAVQLLTLENVDPADVPLWINAANAVVVPSEREGFGLAVLEALACDVPVVATPVGIAPVALEGIDGSYCGEFDPERWREALAPALEAPDPRLEGRARAEAFSTDVMAADVLRAWRALQ